LSARPPHRPVPVSRLVARTDIPSKSVGIFWLGGASVALKSPANKVYVFDPGMRPMEDGGPVGPTDIRPDLVVCTFHSPTRFNLASLTNMSTAFPDVRFAGSETVREWMMGKGSADDIPVNPGRVATLRPGDTREVNSLGVQDRVRLRVLGDVGDALNPWNVLMTFSGLRICLVRQTAGGRLDRLCEEVVRRPDVLIWSLEGKTLEGAREGLSRLRPRYAVPVGYDSLSSGGQLARRFRDLVDEMPSTRSYLFPDDYLEGLIYSRVMHRR